MLFRKWSLTITSIALAVALALGVDWIAAEWLGIGSPVARWWLLTVTLVLVAGSLAFLLGREWTNRSVATHDLELLGRSDSHRLAMTSPTPRLPRRFFSQRATRTPMQFRPHSRFERCRSPALPAPVSRALRGPPTARRS